MQSLYQQVNNQKMLVIQSLEDDCGKQELNEQIAVCVFLYLLLFCLSWGIITNRFPSCLRFCKICRSSISVWNWLLSSTLVKKTEPQSQLSQPCPILVPWKILMTCQLQQMICKFWFFSVFTQLYWNLSNLKFLENNIFLSQSNKIIRMSEPSYSNGHREAIDHSRLRYIGWCCFSRFCAELFLQVIHLPFQFFFLSENQTYHL